jgi:hypothetical protein
MNRLEELLDRRAHRCRLRPDRALETLDEAEEFLRDRGLLTRTANSALPSLYGACHEGPYARGRGGFADWPATKWWWAGALAERPGVHALKIHRGKSVFLTDETVALVDPIARSELSRMANEDPASARVLDHLAAAGPSEPEDLRVELGLKARELKAVRYRLERCGALVSRQVVHRTAEPGHAHSSVIARWDQVFPEPAAGGGLADLVVAGVRAAVVAPEPELRQWFSWRWLFDDGLVDRLVAGGVLHRPEPGWIATT